MADTSSFAQYKRMSGTAAGTTVFMDRNGSFEGVIIGTNKEGTVTFYDVATAAGTAAGNYIVAVNNNSGTIPTRVEMGFRVKNGLVGVSGGTTDVTVVYN